MFAARALALAAVMVFHLHVAFAQSSPFAFEAGGGASLRSATGEMSTIQGIPSPRPLTFTSADASWHLFGYISADARLASWLMAGMRATGASTRATVTAPERVPIARADSVYLATLEHRRVMDATTLALEPFLRLALSDVVSFDVGLPLALPLSTSYRQSQYFTDPSGLQFVDGSVEQVTGSGDIPAMSSVMAFVRARANAELPIASDGEWSVLAHVGASRSITSLHSTASWHDVGLEAGIGLRVRLQTPQPVPPSPQRRIDTVYVRDTVTVLQPGMASPDLILDERIVSDVTEIDPTTASLTIYERYRRVLPKPPAVLDAAIRIVFVGEGGNETIDAYIKGRRQRSVLSASLVPVIAYDDASTDVPSWCVRLTRAQATAFTEHDAMQAQAMERGEHWHRHVLNIIGSRMRRMRRTVLVLRTGGDAGIATARVQHLRAYLQSAFGIESRRLRHEHVADVDADIVMLADPSCDLLGPVTRVDTVASGILPTVRIYPDIASDAGIASWQLSVAQRGTVVHTSTGTADLPTVITWNMQDDIPSADAMRAPFDVVLTVADRDGGMATSDSASITLRESAAAEIGAPIPTIGEWLVQTAPSTGLRPCSSAPPASATTTMLSADDAPSHWAFKGLPAALRRWYNGTWTSNRSNTSR